MRIVAVEKKDLKPGVLYSDINYNLDKYRTKTIVTNMDSIKQNILLIIGTPVKTKWFRPSVGNYLDTFLFDPVDDLNAGKISDEIYRILETSGLEDRIVLEKVDVIPDDPNQQYFVEIFFSVPEFSADNDSLTFGLAR